MSYKLLKDWSLEAISQANELKIIIKEETDTEKIALINQKISEGGAVFITQWGKISKEKYDTIKNIYQETGWVNSNLDSL